MIEKVQPGDVAGVEALFDNTYYTFQRAWLRSLSECSREGCLFAAREGSQVRAALACSRQNRTVFVLCGAAFASKEDIASLLPPLLAQLANHARAHGASLLTYVGAEEWLLPSLASSGFAHSDHVITLLKTGREIPTSGAGEGLLVRPCREEDIEALTALDAAAFPPEWHYGRHVLRRALLSGGSFLVAESTRLVGYAYGDVQGTSAHLTRLAVAPDYRGRGVGARLLSASLRAFHGQGAWLVTLNTQKSNTKSQRLYERFGFQAVGQSVPLLVYALEPQN